MSAAYMSKHPPEPLLDRKQLAAAMGMSEDTLDRKRKSGAIPPPSWTDGVTLRWLLSDVLAHNKRQRIRLERAS